MMIYFSFLFFLLSSFLIYTKKNMLIFLFIIGGLLIVFTGFRYESGIDYENYKGLYDGVYIASSEYLFWFLTIVHKYIFNSFELFVLMSSIILITIKLYILNELIKVELWFGIIVFIALSYISLDMGLLRNSYAFAFFMISFYFLSKDKKKISYFYFLVAFLFHHTVIFMLFIYFVKKNSAVTRKYLLFLFLFLLVSSLDVVYNLVFDFANISYIGSNFPYISWKMNHYLISVDYRATGFNIYVIRFFLFSLIFYFFRNNIKNNFLIKLYIIGTYLILLTSFNIQFYSRIGIFLVLFEMLIMPYLIHSFKGWSKVIVSFLFIIVYGIMFARTSYIFGIQEVKFF